MKVVTPKVFMIAETCHRLKGRDAWLEHLGVPWWKTDASTAGEALIEAAGRRCYRAFEDDKTSVSEMNPNLRKVRKGNQEYIANILKSRHGSVLEHSYVTFAIEDVSRVVTHELVRHRLCNFSQESLRFVRPTSLNTYFPDIFKEVPDEPIGRPIEFDFGVFESSISKRDLVERIFTQTVMNLELTQAALVEVLGMDDSEKLFADKKKLQSAMRRLMPIGMATGIIVTSNHRNWRHMIEMRTSRHAEEEIRLVFNLIAYQLYEDFPAVYQDAEQLTIDGHDEWTFKYGRV